MKIPWTWSSIGAGTAHIVTVTFSLGVPSRLACLGVSSSVGGVFLCVLLYLYQTMVVCDMFGKFIVYNLMLGMQLDMHPFAVNSPSQPTFRV